MPIKPTVVHSDSEILSGTPVFVGTRVPARSLFDYIEGGDTLDEFLRQFPSVTRDQAIRVAPPRSRHGRRVLTMDRKLEFEHDLTAVPFGVVVILARSNRVQDLRPLIGAINEALARVKSGSVERVGT